MRRLALWPLPATWMTALPAGAQGAPASVPGPIQDNSFLLEEAYNQEARVVQHISSFLRSEGGDWAYTFTQEWPVKGQRHQLSYSVPYLAVDARAGRAAGFGDVALNYRLQAVGSGESRLAVAPRLSVLLPTGNGTEGRGSRGTGVQFNLPLSLALSDRLMTHVNAGATFTPAARNAAGDEASTTAVALGQSVIWLARPRLNVMLELVYARYERILAPDTTEAADSLVLSPGLRWAYNFRSGLQIVPGLAVPIGIGPSSGETGLFVYLSFEHPFGRRR